MIAKNYIFGRKYNANFNENLLAYYQFENNAVDVVGGYNGSVVGSPTYPTGVNNLAIDFLNSTALNYVNIPDNNVWSFTDGINDISFTFSMWVKFHSFSSTGNWLINKRGSSSGTDEYQLVYPSSTTKFRFALFDKINNATTIGLISDITPLLNQWYHVVIAYDGSKNVSGLNMYIDGTLQTTKTTVGVYTGMPNGNSIVRLGTASWDANEILKHRGLLDELAVWRNRELNQSEVTELYNSGAGKFYPF